MDYIILSDYELKTKCLGSRNLLYFADSRLFCFQNKTFSQIHRKHCIGQKIVRKFLIMVFSSHTPGPDDGCPFCSTLYSFEAHSNLLNFCKCTHGIGYCMPCPCGTRFDTTLKCCMTDFVYGRQC